MPSSYRKRGEVWIDYLTVPVSSTDKALAADLINFLNDPQRAARNARYVHYATPNAAAERLLPVPFLANPVIYPGRESVSRSEFYVDMPPVAVKLRNAVYARVFEGVLDADLEGRTSGGAE